MITFWIKKLRPITAIWTISIESTIICVTRGSKKRLNILCEVGKSPLSISGYRTAETNREASRAHLQGVRTAALSSDRDLSPPHLDGHHNYGYRDWCGGRNQAVSWSYTQPSYTLPRYSPHRSTDRPLYRKEGVPGDTGLTYSLSSISRLAHSLAPS